MLADLRDLAPYLWAFAVLCLLVAIVRSIGRMRMWWGES